MTAPQPMGQPPTVSQRNGFGITALALALTGLVFGLVPFTGFIALILGALAVLFGLLGVARVRRGEATNRRMALSGTALGVLVAALGVWGISITFNAVEQLGRDPGGIGGRQSAPGASSPVEEPAPEVESTNQLPFGQTFTYEDGIAVTVAAPTAYRPSSSAYVAGGATARAVTVEVTVINGTAVPLDLSEVNVQATAGEQASEQVMT